MESNEIFSLKGKAIIVTGGTGILGKAFIAAIVQAKGHVGILGRNKARAEERANEIEKSGGGAIPLIADILNEEQLKNCREQMIKLLEKLTGWYMAQAVIYPKPYYNPKMIFFQ